MGRRKNRPSPEIALIQRIENSPAPKGAPWKAIVGLDKNGKAVKRKGSAVTEWAMLVFLPKWGRLPEPYEERAAIVSGEIGRYIDKRHKVTVVKREVIGQKNGRENLTPLKDWVDKGRETAQTAKNNERRERMRRKWEALRAKWRREAEAEVLDKAIRGQIPADRMAWGIENAMYLKEQRYKLTGQA